MYFRYLCSAHVLRPEFIHCRFNLLRITPGFLSSHRNQCKKSNHSIKYTPYVPKCYTDHDHKNMKLNRPMSPHLTQYAPTLPAMTSVGQRATGAILTFYAFTLALGALFLPRGVESFVTMIQSLNLGTLTILVGKFLLGAPFAFHYFNALRYIVWNTAKMLEMSKVYASAYQAMGAAVVLATLLAII